MYAFPKCHVFFPGTFIFGPLMGYLIDKYTWRGSLIICAGLMLNCCVCAAFFRPLSLQHQIMNKKTVNNNQAVFQTDSVK